MPDAPHVSLFTRYVLENPLPLSFALLAIAAVFGFMAAREGRKDHALLTLLALAMAAIVFGLGSLIETSGEKAEQVTKDFVKLAVAGDVTGTMAMFSDDAVLTLVSPTTEAQSISFVRSGVEMVNRQYPIDSNRITQLRGYRVASDHGVAHLTCMTDAEGMTAQTQWVISVREQGDGSWKIDKLTWVSMNRQRPSTSMLR